MKRNLLIFVLVLSIAINIGVFGSAGYKWLKSRGEKQSHRENDHSPMSVHCKKLGLSEAQTSEMESLRRTLDLKIEKIRKDLREKRVQLVNNLMKSEPDHTKINIKLREIESLQTELQKIVIDHMLQEKKILSPEQQEIFLSIISKRLCPEGGHQSLGLLPISEKNEKCNKNCQ